MPLTHKQAFKVGFLLKCAQAGMTIEETHETVKQALNHVRMTKQATPPWYLAPFAWLGGKAMDLAGSVAKATPGILSSSAVAGLGIPLAAGAGGGYLTAKLTSSPDKGKDMLEEAKKEEVISEYDRLAQEARRRSKLKRLQDQTGRKIVALTP